MLLFISSPISSRYSVQKHGSEIMAIYYVHFHVPLSPVFPVVRNAVWYDTCWNGINTIPLHFGHFNLVSPPFLLGGWGLYITVFVSLLRTSVQCVICHIWWKRMVFPTWWTEVKTHPPLPILSKSEIWCYDFKPHKVMKIKLFRIERCRRW
jgi:hypothetical protein